MTHSNETQILALCECCALLLANGDDSSCRDYYGHDHKSGFFPADTVLTDETDQPSRAWVCGTCCTRQGAYSYRLWAEVIRPAEAQAVLLTAMPHDGDDYAPHVEAETTTVNGRTVPLLTYFEMVAYLRDVQEIDRHCDVSPDDLNVTPGDGAMTFYLLDYDETETYPKHDDKGHDGLPRYAVAGGWEWMTYAGPCFACDH